MLNTRSLLGDPQKPGCSAAGVAVGPPVPKINPHISHVLVPGQHCTAGTSSPHQPPSPSAISKSTAVPPFEILGCINFHPARFLTSGPFYGLRNATLAAGISVRLHFVK